MFKQISIFAVTLSLSGFMHAAVTLKVQQEIKVEEINGQAISKKIFDSNTNIFQLNVGKNELEISYYQYFDAENGIGSHDIVRSAPVYLNTPALNDNQTYILKLINAPKTNDQAKEFAKQAIFGLYNNKNELLMTQTGTGEHKSILNMLIDGETINARKKNNGENQQNERDNKMNINDLLGVNERDLSESNSFNQLIVIWKNASKKDRKKFMMWLAE